MKKRLLPIALILLLALPLALLLRRLARDVVAGQLLRLLWAGRLLLNSVPQVLAWGALVAIVTGVAVGSLLKNRTAARPAKPIEFPTEGRLATLAELVQRSAKSDFARWRLAQHLTELALDGLVYTVQADHKEARRRLREGEIDAPPQVRAYLQAGTRLAFTRSARVVSHSVQQTELQADPDQVVSFLEQQLENQYEH